MAKVSYDHSGSYRKESSSSYRSYSNRDIDDSVDTVQSDGYRTRYNDFDEMRLEDSGNRRDYRRESAERREHRSSYTYRSEEPRYPTRKQESLNENVNLIQPGHSERPFSVETESVQTDSSRIPMGLEILQNVDRFVIRQNIESEAWWDIARFTVEDGRGKQILEIKQEKADNACLQAVFGKMRQYYMKVYAGNHWIMELEHPWSCLTPIFCPWASPSLIVRMTTGEVLGQVRNSPRETCSACLSPTKYLEVINHDGSIINAATGPSCYPFECKQKDKAAFELLKVETNGNSSRIGQIDHEWRGCCGGMFSCCVTDEQETVTVTFPKDSQAEEKALYLGLGLMALFTFFEVK